MAPDLAVGEYKLDDVADARRADAFLVGAYAVLGCLLVWTRLAWLDRSLWYDEILTVTAYVREGPREILSGSYLPNNHELFSLLGWASTSVLGESEVVLRLWSAVPFILGVIVMTAWLHARVSRTTALFFLFYAAVSPMLLDLSRQARGYGLAFLAMSVLLVAAFEAQRTSRTDVLALFFVAGVLGTWTLPIFGVAFVATAAVLLGQRHLRRRGAVGLAASIVAVVLWFAPHIDDLLDNAGQRDGTQISLVGLAVSPIDRVLIPGLLWFSDTFLTTYPGRLLGIAALGVLILSSPLIRKRPAALLLSAGVVGTLVCVWAARLYLQPRFVSFLLVPLLVLLADGTAFAIRPLLRKPRLRALTAAATVIFATAAFAGAAGHLLRFPFEAWKDAAATVERIAPQGTRVLVYVSKPVGLEYYLDAPIESLAAAQVAPTVCRSQQAVVFVTQPYDIAPVDVPCLTRTGVRHVRLRQHSRGGEINVWLVPPRPRETLVF